ncbi:MAG: ABC transporter ATP-binding protein [Verrucomicrobiota bacterium JB023]|nr:ABC transporter ATP-binding protein [Verrucomicrobiota bacterium JB023]
MAERQNNLAKMKPQRLVWQLMEGFRGTYGWAIASLLFFTLINYLTPLVASATIDIVLVADKEDVPALTQGILSLLGGESFVRENLWLPAVVMVSLTIAAGLFSFLKGRLAATASDGIARRLKDRLYDHLQHLPQKYHDKAETGDLIQRCTSDVETLRLALSTQVVEVSNAILLLTIALPVMVALDWRMTLWSFLLVVPVILFGYFYVGKVKFRFKEVDEAEGQVTRVVQENLTGLRVVRAFGQQQHEIEKFSVPNQQYRDRSLRLLRLMSWYWSISDFAVLLQQGIVLFVGAKFITEGSLTVGVLFAFMMFLNTLLWPVRQMGRILTELGKSVVALNRLGEILSESEESSPTKPRRPVGERVRGEIVFERVSFGHREEQAALKEVSFHLPAGETLAIVGPSGSGKSTILNLLLRFYDYRQGSIRLDGEELSSLERKWVRSQFGIVMQEPFLYSKTIGDNLRQARSGAIMEDLEEAARMADIHETIAGFTSSYETMVGERGVTLSGGQRQRVALARAILQDAPILLLDDALSAVDAETETRILDALRGRRHRRTTIVIAHRLSTLEHADQVIVLEGGRIVQQGTPAELTNKEGLYRRLWTIQNSLEEQFAAANPS